MQRGLDVLEVPDQETNELSLRYLLLHDDQVRELDVVSNPTLFTT